MAIGGFKDDSICFWCPLFLHLLQSLLLLLLIVSVIIKLMNITMVVDDNHIYHQSLLLLLLIVSMLIKPMNIAMVVDNNPSNLFITNIMPANKQNITRFPQIVTIFYLIPNSWKRFEGCYHRS